MKKASPETTDELTKTSTLFKRIYTQTVKQGDVSTIIEIPKAFLSVRCFCQFFPHYYVPGGLTKNYFFLTARLVSSLVQTSTLTHTVLHGLSVTNKTDKIVKILFKIPIFVWAQSQDSKQRNKRACTCKS